MSIDHRLAQGPLRVRTLWDDQMTADLPTATLLRRRQRFVRRTVAASALVAAVGLLTFGLWKGDGPATRSPTLAGASLVEEQAERPGEGALERAGLAAAQKPTLTLADGSLVFAQDASQLTVELETPRLVRTKVHRGTVLYSVTKNDKRSFDVQVGEVDVHVVGTTFAVTRDGDRALVDVEEGTVRVSYEGGVRVLQAGQRDWFPPEPVEASQEPAVEDADGSGPVKTAGKPSVPRAAEREAQPSDWRQLAQQKKYEASYEAMERVKSAISSSASDLMLAADVARLSRHPAEAVRLLGEVASRFPGDPRAPLAEFTRGRVLIENLGQPAQAAQSFARARSLAPGGSLAQDSLVREIEARKAAGQTSQAKALAQIYLSSYPGGRHRAKCEKLVTAD